EPNVGSTGIMAVRGRLLLLSNDNSVVRLDTEKTRRTGGAGMGTEGFSEGRIARMRETMARYAEGGEVPGIVTLVARRGEPHVGAFGTARRDTIYRIASMTKPIVAVAALILIEQCQLRLDDPVDELLPELANRRVLRRLDSALDDTVPMARSITLRDLLTF